MSLLKNMHIWTRYPEPRRVNTRKLISQHQIGAVVPICCVDRVYGSAWDLSSPNWDALDERVESVPSGSPIHAHPLLNRVMEQQWESVNVTDYIFPILDRYPQITRWTLAQELLLRSNKSQRNVFQLYEAVGKAYPHLELWVGEYGLRSRARVYGTAGIISSIWELKAAAPNFAGFIVTEYLDFAQRIDSILTQGKSNWLEEHGLNLDSVESAIQALKQRYTLLTMPEKLNDAMAEISKTGVKIALETSVYTGANPTTYTVARQRIAYELLIDLCDRHGAELWHWNICDEACSMTWAAARQPTDCPGWFDREGVIKPWAVDFLYP